MVELLKEYDTQLFLSINHLPHNFFSDTFFGFVTLIGYFGAIWLLFGLILTLKNKKKTKNLLAAMIAAEVIYLFFVEILVKNRITRLRPKYALPETILPYDFFQSFSFPSGHAAIAFAAAFILGREDKGRRWCYWFLAVLIAFSRIYLGKHYPSDVVVGAILGIMIGYFSLKVSQKYIVKHK